MKYEFTKDEIEFLLNNLAKISYGQVVHLIDFLKYKIEEQNKLFEDEKINPIIQKDKK